MLRAAMRTFVFTTACGAACSSPVTKGIFPDAGDAEVAFPSGLDGAAPDGGRYDRDGGDAAGMVDASSDANVIGDSQTDSLKPSGYSSSLIGYWPFDDSGSDLSGNARPLTLVGPPGFVAGRFGNAISLNGTGTQYAVRSASDSVFDFGPADFTVSIWVRFNSVAPEQSLVEKFDGQVGPGWAFAKLATGEAHFWGRPSAILLSNSLVFQAIVWHHFLARRSGASFAIFVDGSSVATGTNSVAIPATSMPLLVGRRNANDGRVSGVDGALDDLAIWARALTDAEVAGLWLGGTGRAVLP